MMPAASFPIVLADMLEGSAATRTSPVTAARSNRAPSYTISAIMGRLTTRSASARVTSVWGRG